MMIRDGYGGSGWGFIALDQNYEYVKTFRATNGYTTDEHELLVFPDSGYILIGRKDITVDMSVYVPGGRTNARVIETCIQEYTADDSLIFEWCPWDHFDIGDMLMENLTGWYIRFPHMNAIDIDEDGHILLSSRHMCEVTKINRQTGAIIWRLGGVNNQFQFIDDTLQGFSGQHTIRSLGGGHYTIFDNGNLHNPHVSRAVEYVLDTNAMTATLFWGFRDTPDKSSYYMGNVQRLPNTNTLINWALSDLPKLTEVRTDGSKAFEMNFVDQWECYRVHRFPWEGMALRPYLVAESHDDNITLIFNKFGDTNVAYYNIYGDTTPSATDLLDTSELTMKELSNLQNHVEYYFRVTAVDNYGSESNYSNEESVFVDFSGIEDQSYIIKECVLYQNHPNPFNCHTLINYHLPKTSEVNLSVYNLLGQKVTVLVSEEQPAGSYEVEWDATGIESGVYFYKLLTDKGFVQTKKLVLLK
jgi:hypothetical protein